MRITNQMLNETAKRTGIPINSASLLNGVNDDGQGNTLLDALNRNGSSTFYTGEKYRCEKLENAAEQLKQKAECFTADGEDSIFAKAKQSGNHDEICDGVEALISKYNETADALLTASDPLDQYYLKMLKGAAADSKEALSSIGITITQGGALKLDKNKLKETDTEQLEQILGASGTFSTRTAFLAGRISDHAQANTAHLASQYNSAGNTYSVSSAWANKYDFWG